MICMVVMWKITSMSGPASCVTWKLLIMIAIFLYMHTHTHTHTYVHTNAVWYSL